MIIVAQDIYAKAFFVGMTEEEYFGKAKSYFSKIDHMDIEDSIKMENEMRNRERRMERQREIYKIDKCCEYFVVVRSDLKDAILMSWIYPFSGQNLFTSWELYPDHSEIQEIEEIKEKPFYNWDKDEFFAKDEDMRPSK